MKDYKFLKYLGDCKETGYRIFLNGFSWDCNWYYGGGYLSYYNKIGRKKLQIHTHFNIVFLNQEIKKKCQLTQTALWYDLEQLVNNHQYNSKEWWRIKDLYKQFYTLRDCAEVFQYGGYCTDFMRSKKEINKEKAKEINEHIQDIIIPEIIKALEIRKE